MITNSREKDIQAKQEGEANAEKLSKAASSSRQWSGFRNPRIVRVSRSFGGKDRHSKVCTIRGLRDRRIRLSVPTAVQLYDLQDRLGLSQPSKVIDWLLDATKLDIDKLPPLPIPQGFTQFHPQLFSHEPNASQPSFIPSFDANPTFIYDGADQNAMEKSKYWDIDAAFRLKSKEVETGSAADKGKWIKTNEEVIQEGIGSYGGQISAQKFFPMATDHSSNSLPGLLNNAMVYNSYHHSEPSSLSLSQFGSHGLYPSQMNPHTSNAIQLPPSLPLPPASQFFFCPSTTTPALFTPYSSYITTPIESDPRQFNHIQFLSSSSQHVLPHPLMPPSLHSMSLPLKSFPTNENSKLPQSQEDNGSRVDKDNTGS